jgi:hypothetical protein
MYLISVRTFAEKRMMFVKSMSRYAPTLKAKVVIYHG